MFNYRREEWISKCKNIVKEEDKILGWKLFSYRCEEWVIKCRILNVEEGDKIFRMEATKSELEFRLELYGDFF